MGLDTFEEWLASCAVLKCQFEASIPDVMNDYFAGRPPFGKGKKKAEFPDALVISALRTWCSKYRRQIYIVSEDQDMQACCTPNGPLYATKSLKEVLSHGRASAALHDALSEFIKKSDLVRADVWSQAENISVRVESGYSSGARVDVEVDEVEMFDMDITEVVIDELRGDLVFCTAYLDAQLVLRATVAQEGIQVGPDDWEPGFHHRQRLQVMTDLQVYVETKRMPDGSFEIQEVEVSNERVHVPWGDVDHLLD